MSATVRNGIDCIDRYASLLQGKRLGLLTNPTGVNRDLKPTVDILHEKFQLTMLFGPEHGIRGAVQHRTGDSVDEKTGIPVNSMFSENGVLPSKAAMEQIDAAVYDIQDVGARFYTFVTSMSYLMEACAEAGKTMIVLDRVNPINARTVQGVKMDLRLASFIGRFSVPARHGLTAGEYARFINRWIGCRLEVIPCEGYRREMDLWDTDLPYLLPSPNLPSMESCFLYPGTCFMEGINASEGRGTCMPFQYVGAPHLDTDSLIAYLESFRFAGVRYRPVYFEPMYHKYQGQLCRGVHLMVTDRKALPAVKLGTALVYGMKQFDPDFAVRAGEERSGAHFSTLTCEYGSDSILLWPEIQTLFDAQDRDSEAFAREKRFAELYD